MVNEFPVKESTAARSSEGGEGGRLFFKLLPWCKVLSKKGIIKGGVWLSGSRCLGWGLPGLRPRHLCNSDRGKMGAGRG